MIIASFSDVQGKRDTNLQYSLADSLLNEGRKESDLYIR
jgi:hypothetical protein